MPAPKSKYGKNSLILTESPKLTFECDNIKGPSKVSFRKNRRIKKIQHNNTAVKIFDVNKLTKNGKFNEHLKIECQNVCKKQVHVVKLSPNNVCTLSQEDLHCNLDRLHRIDTNASQQQSSPEMIAHYEILTEYDTWVPCKEFNSSGHLNIAYTISGLACHGYCQKKKGNNIKK